MARIHAKSDLGEETTGEGAACSHARNQPTKQKALKKLEKPLPAVQQGPHLEACDAADAICMMPPREARNKYPCFGTRFAEPTVAKNFPPFNQGWLPDSWQASVTTDRYVGLYMQQSTKGALVRTAADYVEETIVSNSLRGKSPRRKTDKKGCGVLRRHIPTDHPKDRPRRNNQISKKKLPVFTRKLRCVDFFLILRCLDKSGRQQGQKNKTQ